MTNKSMALILSMRDKNNEQKELILKEVVSIEYKKIKAQAKNFLKNGKKSDKIVESIINCNSSDELFECLKKLSVIEISIITSYGIEVSYMNMIKVSE